MFASYHEIKFSDADVVNSDDFIPASMGPAAPAAYNPHNVRPWLIHDAGFTVAIVFASCEQDALDEAADAGKLDGFQVSETDLVEYGPDEEGIARLGNAGEAFDIQTLDMVALPNPPFSFVALFNALR